jgi:hypothetical protein
LATDLGQNSATDSANEAFFTADRNGLPPDICTGGDLLMAGRNSTVATPTPQGIFLRADDQIPLVTDLTRVRPFDGNDLAETRSKSLRLSSAIAERAEYER